jgi:uncharacterized protein (DUF111 family)
MSTNSKTAFADLKTLIENSIKKKAGKQVGTADNALLTIIQEHAEKAMNLAEEERRVLIAKIEDLRYELMSSVSASVYKDVKDALAQEKAAHKEMAEEMEDLIKEKNKWRREVESALESVKRN